MARRCCVGGFAGSYAGARLQDVDHSRMRPILVRLPDTDVELLHLAWEAMSVEGDLSVLEGALDPGGEVARRRGRVRLASEWLAG